MKPSLACLLRTERSETADFIERSEYWEIGRGGVGVVFQSPGTKHVAVKLYEHAAHPASERYQPARLGNDYLQHKRMERAWTSSGAENLPVIPKLLAFLPAGGDGLGVVEVMTDLPRSNEDFWRTSKQYLHDYWKPREGNDILISERIPALPSHIREQLIASYCPPSLRQRLLESGKDRDCLVRLYLGKRNDVARERPSRFFSLRNFKLKLDQALDEEDGLGFEATKAYAITMARALAVCHWVAGVDANDVEFALGGSSTADNDFSALPPAAAAVSLWMFDFDKSNCITEWNLEGMRKAAVAAEDNDPYFPRPCSGDGVDAQLWTAFRDAYIMLSMQYVGGDEGRQGLPAAFIEQWCAIRQERLEKRQKANQTD